jgi:hypothetical protein
LATWLDEVGQGRFVVLEFGAGLAVPTVRRFGERMAAAGAIRWTPLSRPKKRFP